MHRPVLCYFFWGLLREAESCGKYLAWEKGLAKTAISLQQDQARPWRTAGAENRESTESLPGAVRKRIYHFRICRPVFQGKGNLQAASVQNTTNRDRAAYQREKRSLQRVPGKERERLEIVLRRKSAPPERSRQTAEDKPAAGICINQMLKS